MEIIDKQSRITQVLEIPFGKTFIKIRIPQKNISQIVYPVASSKKNERKILRQALENPSNSKILSDFLDDAKQILIIVNDATRPTPTAKVLEMINPFLEKTNFRFIVATGNHREPTNDEYHRIFGRFFNLYKDKIFSHNSKKEDELYHLGTTKRGTDIWINRLAEEADKIIIIGSVEPHYFAGYTGGRKAIVPGIASYKTIEQNHEHALESNAKTLTLKDNPVHEDMDEAITILNKEIFSIMTVLDKDHDIYVAAAGDIFTSFLEAVIKADDIYTRKIHEKADIVVAVVNSPLDINLYQSQKGIENGKSALKENGILILVSKCSEGIGDATFADLLRSCDQPEQILKKIAHNYVLGYHKAANIAKMISWSEIRIVSDIEPDKIRELFLKPDDTIQDAIDTAIAKKGDNSKIVFLMDAAVTVPKFSG